VDPAAAVAVAVTAAAVAAANGEAIGTKERIKEPLINRSSRSSSPKPAVTIRQATTDSGKEDGIEVIGKVVEKFRAGMFSIELEGGKIVLGMMAGRLRRNRIKVMNGDRVSVELSPYDLSKGRITYRHK
jgi:translation initiation factor IF-1